ncbi:Targeting protein for Xklp2 [Habropoda laboriosa]|uniref:Targeting protein for Xklp2 n=2 Tax=Habropoda laboriosa TaxID=597456 RepID=A0A0L7QT57_9HYME|nr:Targeting protein for Xklp2 [Habropoda laboriosa]
MSKTKNTVLGFSSKNIVKKKNNVQIGLTKDKSKSVAKTKADNCVNSLSEERLSFKIVSASPRKLNSFKTKQCSLGKSQPKVLTCQYRRRSLMKYRRCSNQFVSLAEAVSKYQNGTPQRFRTISNKDLKPGPLTKLKQSPLKLTFPVSPALRSKQRRRKTTILSEQEREKLELEERKKHQVKANPIPINILKGPSVLKKVAKKPTTITEEFHLTQSRKTRHTASVHQMNLQQNDEEQKPKKVLPITRSSSASNVTIKKENAYTKSTVDKPNKFGFEIHNKEYQIKKEEKFKNLHVQNTNKVKFHARPAPNFSKPTNPVKQQVTKKRIVVPCPFSFEERNKTLAKKKEELVKQMQEQAKKAHVFHANPVPSFKPVLVHGLSKENLRNKDKTATSSKELVTRQTKSYNDQENRQPNIMNNTSICVNPKKKEVMQHIANNESDEKKVKNNVDIVDAKNEKLKTSQKKISKFELNTDKRAKERNVFDDKIRKKELDLEMKRQELEKSRLLKEKMERAEMRKMAEVKARPMPVYKPVVVLKSTKLPTCPHSPAWGNRPKPKSIS